MTDGLIETMTTSTSRDPAGFVVQVVKEGVMLDAAAAREDLAASLEFMTEPGAKLLVDASAYHSLTRSARQILVEGSRDRVAFLAIVTGGGLGAVVARFFVGMYPHGSGSVVKLFGNRSEAKAWLVSQGTS